MELDSLVKLTENSRPTYCTVYNRVVQISIFFYFNYGKGGGNFIWVREHDFKQNKNFN